MQGGSGLWFTHGYCTLVTACTERRKASCFGHGYQFDMYGKWQLTLSWHGCWCKLQSLKRLFLPGCLLGLENPPLQRDEDIHESHLQEENRLALASQKLPEGVPEIPWLGLCFNCFCLQRPVLSTQSPVSAKLLKKRWNLAGRRADP